MLAVRTLLSMLGYLAGKRRRSAITLFDDFRHYKPSNGSVKMCG